MLHLALSQKEGVVMSRGIAESANLPETYLEQLMLALRKAGLLTALRGSRGGYMLARPAESISLAQIVEALEGAIKIVNCADVPNCCNAQVCALQEVFAEVNKALYTAFDGVTLAELADRQREKDADAAPMYYI